MVPVMQTIPFEEGSVVYGNCLQAAVAAIYELPIEAVPHFVQFTRWGEALRMWVEDQGADLLLWKSDEPQDVPLLAFGKSPRGDFRHAVVWQAGRMIHDPHPDGTGLDGAPEEYWGILRPAAPESAMSFTCGLRIWCTRCSFHACANPEHKEYAEDPHEAMREHKVTAHPVSDNPEED